MLKRSTKESVQDVLASNEIYVSVSKTPEVTKLIWHIDPPSLDDDMKARKAPEAKYLQILSACLTGMVLWGIFWQIHNHLIPQLFYRSPVASSLHDSSSFALAQIQANANAFVQGDLSADHLVSNAVGVGAKRLLEFSDAEQLTSEQQKNHVDTSWGGSLWPVLHRKLLSDLDHAKYTS